MKLGERLKSFIKNNRANFPGEKNYNEAKIVKCIASFACIEKHRNSSSRNRPFSQCRHFDTTTRMLFVFPVIFKFGNPCEV